jgi:hypothetical protein
MPMNLRLRIGRLEQQLDVGRRAAFVFINIPGGKPVRLCYDDGTEEEWVGGENYPPGVTVFGRIDPDLVLGRVLVAAPRQATGDE